MNSDEDEHETRLASHDLAGKRQREDDAVNTDIEASPRPAKVSRISGQTPPQQPLEGSSLVERTIPEYTIRQRITKDSLQSVRDRLSDLTLRNKEIKDSIQSLRQTVIDDLFSHAKVRQIAIGQLGRNDLDEDMHQLCTKALSTRREEIFAKQKELITLEELLSGHTAVLDFANSAYEELEQNIKLFENALTAEQCTALSTYDFPHMSALARLTGGIVNPNPPIQRSQALGAQHIGHESRLFPRFADLPPEARVLIWQEGLPGHRIITHHSRHNHNFSLLAVNRESRAAVQARLTKLLSPTFDTTKTDTKIIYTNVETDTIVRDLANPGGPDIFSLDPIALNQACYRLFIGLVKVKHLALAFDLINNNGGQIFGSLQACCPELQTLTLFPSSQVEGSPLKVPRLSSHHTLKFIDVDSNVIDYVSFRWDQLTDRYVKRKALRGIAVLLTLYDHAQQYHKVFPEYIAQYGREWNLKIRVCLMAKWNNRRKAWQTRYLEGDRYSRGFSGIDGRLYRGFIESGMICGEDGELLSRYDGMARTFGE